MSCELYGRGDRCIATSSFTVTSSEGDMAMQVRIEAGYEGVVRDKNEREHQLLVFWPRLEQALVLDHEQIHNLRHM